MLGTRDMTATARPERSRPKLVLVVDDDDDIREVLALTLEGLGYRVETAGDGLRALDRVRQGAPDLVLFDLNMPHCDGLRLCRELLRLEFSRDRLLLMSGAGDGAERAAHLGVRFLKKPLEVQDLKRALGR